MDKTCGTCRWWGGRISGRVENPGPCNRYPPTVWPHGQFGIGVERFNVRPTMRAGSFCGEHTPKEPPHAG